MPLHFRRVFFLLSEQSTFLGGVVGVLRWKCNIVVSLFMLPLVCVCVCVCEIK